MEWYYYAIAGGFIIGGLIMYIILARKGLYIPIFSHVADPLLLGERRSWDNRDLSLRDAYRIFDGRKRKERIQDRTRKPVKKTYTRADMDRNLDNINEEWEANPENYDIIGVDTPDPPYPRHMLVLFTGVKHAKFNFDNSKNKLVLGTTTEQHGPRFKSSGMTPDVDTAASFSKGVLVKMNIDNRKRTHEQKVRPVPYYNGQYYPEYATKVKDYNADTPLQGDNASEYEWDSRDELELTKRDVDTIYVNQRYEQVIRRQLPSSWQSKVKVVKTDPRATTSDSLGYQLQHAAERDLTSTEKTKIKNMKQKKWHGRHPETGKAIIPKWSTIEVDRFGKAIRK